MIQSTWTCILKDKNWLWYCKGPTSSEGLHLHGCMPAFQGCFQTQSLNKTHSCLSPSAWGRGRGWSQAAEQVVWPVQQGGTGPCNPWGLEPSAVYLSQSRSKCAFCPLPLCHSANYSPSSGQPRAAPSWCWCSSNPAVAAACKEPPWGRIPAALNIVYSLVGAPCKVEEELVAFISFSGLAPKVAVVCVVTSSASWGLGKEQGRCELLRGAVNVNLLWI